MFSSILAVGFLSLCSSYSPSVRNAPYAGNGINPSFGIELEENNTYNSFVARGAMSTGMEFGTWTINAYLYGFGVSFDYLPITISTYWSYTGSGNYPYLAITCDVSRSADFTTWVRNSLMWADTLVPYDAPSIISVDGYWPALDRAGVSSAYGFVLSVPHFYCLNPFLVVSVSNYDADAYCWYIDPSNQYNSGYASGLLQGNQTAYDQGYADGEAYGHQQGYAEGVAENYPSYVGSLITSIVDVPINILNGLSPFVLWNIPVISIVLSVMVIAVILIIVKKFV